MEDLTTLDCLAAGRRGLIAGITAPEEQRLRLLELGFVPGGRITTVLESPWGDPAAYAVCGAVIALRRADARQIAIRQS